MHALIPGRTALVLIDLMDRIVDLPLEPHSGRAVVDTAVALAREFRGAGVPVVAVRVERPGVSAQPPGSELVGEVADLADVVVVKRTIGGFHETGLHDVLRERGVSTLVVAGIATNLGVESTARAAADHGYDLVFVEDAVAEHDAAIALNFPHFGDVVASADLGWAPSS
jgi:nicotinamidase-related amidase